MERSERGKARRKEEKLMERERERQIGGGEKVKQREGVKERGVRS